MAAIRGKIAPIAEKAAANKPKTQSPGDRRDADVATRRLRAPAIKLRDEFLHRLSTLSILDPACGSGNFLYLALQGVKDIENRAVLECEAMGLPPRDLGVGPEILHGIEINAVAAELARTTIWIGDIQWAIHNGIYTRAEPFLRPLDAIECRDAMIAKTADGEYVEAKWPRAEFIVGNPPFLGSRKMQPDLGSNYVAALRRTYHRCVPTGADLVCFWIAKSWDAVNAGDAARAGLVATNSIAEGASRSVLKPIADNSRIFEAWRDEPWIVEGAAVRVAIICFGKQAVTSAYLDGHGVRGILSDLRAPADVQDFDLTKARVLAENRNLSFQGVVPRGSLQKKKAKEFGLVPATFVVPGKQAREMLKAPLNPNGRPNSDVVVPFLVSDDITGRPLDRFVVDFGEMVERDAAFYDEPYNFIARVKLHRAKMTQPEALQTWWRHWRARPEMREALKPMKRFIVTSRVAKYRLFVWRTPPILADNAIVVIAREDDTTFGVVNSIYHGVWALRQGTRLGVGNDPRYTSTTTFETFPFPNELSPNTAAKDYAENPRAIAIACAGKRLDELRNNWLNPTDLVDIVPEVTPTAALGEAPRRYPERIVPKTDEAAVKLKKRKLTNLYNQRPRWLADAHDELDRAVAAAYG
jgi:type II restriction/modification system DNA methylase subunit YeeA